MSQVQFAAMRPDRTRVDVLLPALSRCTSRWTEPGPINPDPIPRSTGLVPSNTGIGDKTHPWDNRSLLREDNR